MSRRGLGFLDSLRGEEAVEFALILPALIALTVGVMEMLLLLFANTALHWAVDEGARCMSVKTTVCTDTTSTTNYTAKRYFGPDISATFTAVVAPCGGALTGPSGSKVSGSGRWVINAVIFRATVPLSATACFPR